MKKIINVFIYNPANSFFKSSANEKAKCNITSCSFAGECPLLKKGQCIHLQSFGRCKYGSLTVEEGFTKRAKGFNSWIENKKKQYASFLDVAKPAPQKMCIIGEYIYLPYAHLNMNKNINFAVHGNVFISGDSFLPLFCWNVATIKQIISFRPQALMGGEITSYQKDVVPLFLQHLKEEFPELYKEAKKEIGFIDETKKSFIGRKAFLKTCKPGSIFVQFPGKPDIQSEWCWDGEKLTSNKKPSFPPVDGGFESSQIIIFPSDTTIIKIDDESQVQEGITMFVD